MSIQYAEQGDVAYYPHSDFDGPCTCAECCGDEEMGYVPRCQGCNKPLHHYGTCAECKANGVEVLN